MEKIYIIYGAGRQGIGYMNFLVSKNAEDLIYGFCDEEEKEPICGKQVYKYEQVKKSNIPFLIAISNTQSRQKIIEQFKEDGVAFYSMDELASQIGMDRVTFNREYCAFFHICDMDTYFKAAEEEAALARFWEETSPFAQLFEKLDLSNVIELACGRGRHVPKYADRAGNITLVDILDKNIEFCKERFKIFSNIEYLRNNGYNLEALPSNEYTSLFCYDAMVHFEMMDIYEYLKDIYRVLKSGGRALIHHSNFDGDYKASFGSATYGRNFMNKQLFAYLAYRIGFVILEQKVIDWDIKDLDCITLIEKA